MSSAMEGTPSKHKRRQEKKRKREAEAALDEEAEAAPAKKNKKHRSKRKSGIESQPSTVPTTTDEAQQSEQVEGTENLQHKQRRERRKQRRAAARQDAQHEQSSKRASPVAISKTTSIVETTTPRPGETADEKDRRARKEAKQQRIAKERQERQAKKEPKTPLAASSKSASEKRARKDHTRALATSLLPNGKNIPHRHAQDQLIAWTASSKGGWTVSGPSAGRFIDCKPYLTADERRVALFQFSRLIFSKLTSRSRLVCATETAIHVYTTSDSLLEHTLPSKDDGAVSCYTLSTTQPNVVYMATEAGRIATWDLRTAKSLGNWATGFPISDIQVTQEQGSSRELVFTISKASRWTISAHRLGLEEDLSKNEAHSVLTLDKPLQSLQVLRQGEIIVAISSDSLIVGKRVAATVDSLEGLRYAWREVTCAEAPICFSARLASGATGKNKTALNVAVGGVKGCVFMYLDLLVQLGFEKHAGTELERTPVLATRALHWHRESVETVAWSLDGNYLISGGMETVLVLWQLDTGKKQFLPNLESTIQALTVSPSGASYVVRLGDNSIMVLSTSELMPTSNIANLQSWSLPAASRVRPELPTMEMWSALSNASEHTPEVNAAINPRRPIELLAAVCSFQRDSNIVPTTPSAPYLQTFDIPRSRNIARQTLTRTNATNLNMGPDGNRIAEPDVKHLQVSSNGLWLATVDEWTPYPADVDDLSADLQDAKAAVDQQRTVQLRFWSWQEAGENSQPGWALNSRIDSPHMLDDSQTPGRVLCLVSDPAGTGFATIGQDSRIKVWEPKTKLSNGKVIRGEGITDTAGNGQTAWSVRRVIPLEKGMSSEPFRRLAPCRARLAYSQDGSTLAASQHFEASAQHRESSLVHLIDPEEDHVRQSRTDIFNGADGIQALGFLGRYLICVGHHEAVVWDITTMEAYAHIDLPPSRGVTSLNIARPAPLLAINIATSTFAIASPVTFTSPAKQSFSSGPLRAYTSKLDVFALADLNRQTSKPVWSALLPRLALSLLSVGGNQGENKTGNAADSKGYVIVDAGAAIRTVRPLSSVETGTMANVTSDPVEEPIEADVQMVEQEEESSDDEDLDDAVPVETGPADRTVVRPEQLAQLLDYPAHAMPPMHELFDNVLRLYAPKAPAVRA